MGLGQSKRENAENIKQAPSRLSDFLKSKGNVQGYLKKRQEKEKPKEEESTETEYDPKTKTYQRKKKAVEPSQGFISRMMDKYWYKKGK